MIRSLVSILFLPALLSSLVQAQDCITQHGKSFEEHADKVYAVSEVVQCYNGTECKATSQNSHITVSRFLNVTTDNADEIFDLLDDIAFTKDFEKSITDDVGEGIGCTRDDVNSTYAGLQPMYNCVTGKLGDCFEDVDAGTSFKACYPDTEDEADGEGLYGLITCIDGSKAPDVEFNPPSEEGRAGRTVDGGFFPLLLLSSLVAVASYGFWLPL